MKTDILNIGDEYRSITIEPIYDSSRGHNIVAIICDEDMSDTIGYDGNFIDDPRSATFYATSIEQVDRIISALNVIRSTMKTTLTIIALLMSLTAGAQSYSSWVDLNKDGLADKWTCANGQPSIITNGQWHGNAQQVIAYSGQFELSTIPADRRQGYHSISLKYTASVPVQVVVWQSEGEAMYIGELAPTDQPVTVRFQYWASSQVRVSFWSLEDSGWLQLDDVVMRRTVVMTAGEIRGIINSAK